jgi:proteasome accessory factor C
MKPSSGALRVTRLLQLIPFLQANSGVSVQSTAQIFNISEEQLISDLNLIWLCGLPGYSHLELIDVSYDSGVININNAETIDRPMRLSFDECGSLLLAIETLINIAPVSDSNILLSLRGKLLRAMELSEGGSQEEVSVQEFSKDSSILPVIFKALESPKKILNLSYYSSTLDSSIHAQIIPERVFMQNGFSYLTAFSLTSDEHVMFRVDRIESATLAPPSIKVPASFDELARQVSNQDFSVTATVELRPEAYWFIQKWGLTDMKYDQERQRFSGVIKIYNPAWLVRAALSLGGALEVMAPATLRAEVAKAAESALERYR